MKKFALVFMSMFLMLLGTANVAKAEVNEPKDFVGKWTATIVGLPDGDVTMTVDLKLDGDKLVGTYCCKGQISHFLLQRWRLRRIHDF